MTNPGPHQAEVDALNVEYKTYIDKLRIDWRRQNQFKSQSRDVYEVMRDEDRKQVDQHIANWGEYVTPFAEAWWKERGYGVVWPDDDSKPMQLRKLEDA